MKQIECGMGASLPRQTAREDIIDTHQGRESARARERARRSDDMLERRSDSMRAGLPHIQHYTADTHSLR